MSDPPTWTNADTAGRIVPPEHHVRAIDPTELVAALNRRRRLGFLAERGWSFSPGEPVRAAGIDDLREDVIAWALTPPPDPIDGDPPTPTEMCWLWPESDEDEGRILRGADTERGEVSLYRKLNGTTGWTDPGPVPAQTFVRAVHVNELRQAFEWIRRGRWRMPVYLPAGIFSLMPDTPWSSSTVANTGTDELRVVGLAVLRTDEVPPKGLVDVSVRASSSVALTADVACTLELYHCEAAVDFEGEQPTWNSPWSSPGALSDSTRIGSCAAVPGAPGTVTGGDLQSALQAMIDGAEQNFLVRRADTGWESVTVSAELIVEFDLNTPPSR